ncbi:hypothetical protein ACFL56_03085 [Candidatus Margulisiibacteriota bacterium]
MTHYNSSWKNCSTCNYWSGTRVPDSYKKGVNVDSNAEGKCMGKWKNSKRKAVNQCSSWGKWSILR